MNYKEIKEKILNIKFDDLSEATDEELLQLKDVFLSIASQFVNSVSREIATRKLKRIEETQQKVVEEVVKVAKEGMEKEQNQSSK